MSIVGQAGEGKTQVQGLLLGVMQRTRSDWGCMFHPILSPITLSDSTLAKIPFSIEIYCEMWVGKRWSRSLKPVSFHKKGDRGGRMVHHLRVQCISLWQASLHHLLRHGQMRGFLCGGPSSRRAR